MFGGQDGLVATSGGSGFIPLVSYYSSELQVLYCGCEQMALQRLLCLSRYSHCIFPGAVCVSTLTFYVCMQDWMVTSADAGHAWARSRGYEMQRTEGYVSSTPQSSYGYPTVQVSPPGLGLATAS